MQQVKLQQRTLTQRTLGLAGAILDVIKTLFNFSSETLTIPSNLDSSRSTTGTLTDFEGLIETADINEMRMNGFRRVENLLSHSEDFSHSDWVKTGTATVTGTNVLNFPAEEDWFYQRVYGGSANEHGVYRVELSGSGTITLRIADFAEGTNEELQITLTSTPTVYTISSLDCGTDSMYVYIYRNTGDTATQVTATEAQLEFVTGQANQNPSEYVSRDALSSPYHGYFADGVKYFNTLNGNTVLNNIVTEATGAEISTTVEQGLINEPQGTNLFIDSDSPVTQNITVVSGTEYTVSFGDGTGSIVLSNAGTGTVDKDNSVTFTASSTTLTCTLSGDVERPQVETGSYPSTYVPTAGTAVTRNADILSVDNTLRDIFPNSFCFLIDFVPMADGGDLSASAKLMGTQDSRAYNYEVRVYADTVAYGYDPKIGGAGINLDSAELTSGTRTVIAFQAKQNVANADVLIYKDGTQEHSESNIQTLDHSNEKLEIGNWEGAYQSPVIIKAVKTYKPQSESKLAKLTTL